MTAIPHMVFSSRLVPPATVVGSDPPLTAPSSFQNSTFINETTALVNGGTVVSIGLHSTNANTVTMKIVKRNSSTNVDVVVSQSLSHPGGGWADLTLSSKFAVPNAGAYYVGAYFSTNGTLNYNASQTRLSAASDITGTAQAVTETASASSPSFRAMYG